MTYRYPWRSMLPDYTRAAAGIACTVTPLALLDLPVWVSAVLAALTAVFLAFAAQAVLRHATRILVSARDIRAFPMGTRLDWDRLTRLKLAYFSVRRDGRRGWMELKLKSGRRTLRIDSRLDGFNEVVRQAAGAASQACVRLEASTISNLNTLGIDTGAEGGAGERVT